MEIVTIVIIATNLLVSYKGFQDPGFFSRHLFQVGRVLEGREYHRLVTSGFLHVDWTHLLFNMISFYSFSISLERFLGPVQVAVIYFAALLGGDVLALAIHRHHRDYKAVGASGAVSGIIFAAIALFPGIAVSIFFLPIAIPGWLFGLIYVVYSIYGIRSGAGNIGHEAHLGGALVGLATVLLLQPAILEHNTRTVMLIAVPSLVFLLLLVFRPGVLKIGPSYHAGKKVINPDDRYNAVKREEEEELNRLLDKVRQSGIDALTAEERRKLDDHAS